jgi:lipoyl(octanoyl) transferase
MKAEPLSEPSAIQTNNDGTDFTDIPPAAYWRDGVEWLISRHLVYYADALAFMEARVAAIIAGRAPETVWLLEHSPVYTAGTSAQDCDLLDPQGIDVFRTGRGGQYTYHGPGQRVAYVMLDLNARRLSPRDFVCCLEKWMMATCAALGLETVQLDKGRGLWTLSDAKVASVGVRIRRGVSFHGISCNVKPDLAPFAGIVPCGFPDGRVTSLAQENLAVTMAEFDTAAMEKFTQAFAVAAPPPHR